MFKNSKEKSISTEELEKMYKYQNKSFEGKIAEQQHKIEELTDFISARFEEDVANSNIATKIKNIEKNLQEIETKYKTNLEKTTKALKKQIEKEGERIATDLNEAQAESYFKLLQKNEADIAKIQDVFVGKDNKLLELNKKIQKHIKNNEIYIKQIEDELKEINQKISKINYLGISSKFDKKLKEESNKIDEKVSKELSDVSGSVESTASLIGALDERLSGEIATTNEQIERTINSVSSLDEKLLKEKNATDKKIENKLNKLDKKLLEKIEEINTYIQNGEIKINKLEEDFTNKVALINESMQGNQTEISTLQTNIQKEIEQVKQESNNLYTKFETECSEKIDAKLQQVITNVEDNKLEVINLESKLKGYNEQIRKSVVAQNKKIRDEINSQIINQQNENKTELQNIAGTIDNMKSQMESSIENIGQEVLMLREQSKTNFEKQDNNNTNIELLKKEYNKYVTKMNNELAKISKSVLNVQKKNLETNQNLQVKIKAYIDNKIEKPDNTQKVEEIINKINLSMQEREKLQKIEMEELLNKKLKVIQKENERLLNKKIEEMASKLIRENSTSTTLTKTNPNNVTIHKEEPKKEKNMYELIAEKQMLKRGAASKNPLSTSKEGKSQILKFFYDDVE